MEAGCRLPTANHVEVIYRLFDTYAHITDIMPMHRTDA